MRRFLKHATCIMLCSTMLGACSMTKEHRDQILGGILGAAGGAAVGALAGRGDPGAIVAGAVGGAVVGWGAVKLTQYHAERVRPAGQEAKALGYSGSQGTVVKIRGASTTPGHLKPGQAVILNMDYTVLAPADTASVPVRETWELWKDNQVLTKLPPQDEEREPGGWAARASIDLPAGAEPGTYIVKNRVEAGSSYDERETHFVIGG